LNQADLGFLYLLASRERLINQISKSKNPEDFCPSKWGFWGPIFLKNPQNLNLGELSDESKDMKF